MNRIKTLKTYAQEYQYYSIKDLSSTLTKLPYCLKILLENTIRKGDSEAKVTSYISSFEGWVQDQKSTKEIDYFPSRVLMQDFTGVPAVVDLAAMRDHASKTSNDPLKINPLIPVDLVIDHSVQVDRYATADSLKHNTELEMKRNKERYEFLKWGQNAFNNLRVVPPGKGICHQINLEYLARVVWTEKKNGKVFAYPDTVVGTDSHTTMIAGLSVLGWGVGGIEAEAAMLGQPLPMIIPEVIGFRLRGKLGNNVTATDLVLTVTEILRKAKVVDKIVEFFGDGLNYLSLADRATIANMAPEYGATTGFFPITQETLDYLKLSARPEEQIQLVEHYAKAQGLWYDSSYECVYTNVIDLDLSTIEPSLAGPKRPQDRLGLASVQSNFITELPNLSKGDAKIQKLHTIKDREYKLGHGKVVIAAITSCTNTSNPSVMVGAGLLAKAAVEKGLQVKPWVKTSLAPGSQVVTEYLKLGNLIEPLDRLGFNLVGYGCTTCIGNSGPLLSEIEECITNNKLVVASVLSGNRNFEGRVHPLVRANYLASPLLVVAYALCGDVNINIADDVIGVDKNGNNVYLKDIWPTVDEINSYIKTHITPDIFKQKYNDVFHGDELWQSINVKEGKTYEFDRNSTYIALPPYFGENRNLLHDIKSAEILAIFGDSITTDHISPAGNIGRTSVAAKYLMECGVKPEDFNSYGARRGNHNVMMRGTFANIRIRNLLCKDVEGGVTVYHKTGEQMSIYDAAMLYKNAGVSTVIFAGKEYGTGSSRDWAAKGPSLLGVKAIIAQSFERIHRSNLVGMGVMPLTFKDNISVQDLSLKGNEKVTIIGMSDGIVPRKELKCRIEGEKIQEIPVILQVFTEDEVEYIKSSSILHKVFENLIQ